MKTETSYTKQANNLLNKMGVKFSANFIKNGYHFNTDKETRDIFNCTFSRGGKKFSIRFGQSLNDSTGTGDNAPTSYDVVSCIQKYDVGSFEDFCNDFGYDTDSRTAEKTYRAVCKEFEKVEKFFTPAEIEELQEIQ